MADFSHQPKDPQGAPPRNDQIHSEQDLTHQVQGPLGPMTVVPDDYAGPMPAGAVRQTDYHRMTSVYGNIESGQSSLQIDTSDFFKDKNLLQDPAGYMQAVGDAAAFRGRYMGYMQDLVKTPAGLEMLEQLDSSKFTTTLKHGEGGNAAQARDWDNAFVHDGKPGKGSGSDVFLDPNAAEWDGENCHGTQPWMTDRPRFGFYHELVHAYHNTRGDADVSEHGHGFTMCGDPHDIPWPIQQTEWQTAGLGPYAGLSVSENAIRAQMGVPLRTTYSGGTYETWNQQTDAEEPPVRSPRR